MPSVEKSGPGPFGSEQEGGSCVMECIAGGCFIGFAFEHSNKYYAVSQDWQELAMHVLAYWIRLILSISRAKNNQTIHEKQQKSTATLAALCVIMDTVLLWTS